MKRAFTFVELLIILGVLGIISAIVYPMFARSRETCCRPTCQSNLKNIGLGHLQYVQDYNEKYPRVAFSKGEAFGWADALQPYIKSAQVFQCMEEPTRQPQINPRMSGHTDYWMNARFSGSSQRYLNASALTIFMGDGNNGDDFTNARYAFKNIPQSWKGNRKSPLYRHTEGLNFAFADGHAKWFAAEKIEAANLDALTKSGRPTFSLK